MPFEKNHKLGAHKKILTLTPDIRGDSASQMLFKGFKGYEGQKAKLFAVPNWQERLREFVDELIK